MGVGFGDGIVAGAFDIVEGGVTVLTGLVDAGDGETTGVVVVGKGGAEAGAVSVAGGGVGVELAGAEGGGVGVGAVTTCITVPLV